MNLKGLSYEQVAFELRKEQHLARAFMAINPQQLVPALCIGDAVLSYSPAIIEWLEERYRTLQASHFAIDQVVYEVCIPRRCGPVAGWMLLSPKWPKNRYSADGKYSRRRTSTRSTKSAVCLSGSPQSKLIAGFKCWSNSGMH